MSLLPGGSLEPSWAQHSFRLWRRSMNKTSSFCSCAAFGSRGEADINEEIELLEGEREAVKVARSEMED